MPSVTNTSVTLPAITNMSNLVSVQLKEENYLVWRHQITSVFESLDLVKFIDGTYLAPLENDSEFTTWKKLNKYVEICINATLDSAIAHIAVGTTSALDLWKKIETLYLQQISARKVELQTRLHHIKQGNRTISDYCHEINTIAQSLTSVGTTVTDSDLVIVAITGLNRDYRVLAVNIENSSPLPSFVQLRSKLLVYEQRLNRESQDTSSVEVSAMAASHLPPHLDSRKSSKQVNLGDNCQICHKSGHLASKCWWRFEANNDAENSHGRGNDRGNGGRGNYRGLYRGGGDSRRGMYRGRGKGTGRGFQGNLAHAQYNSFSHGPFNGSNSSNPFTENYRPYTGPFTGQNSIDDNIVSQQQFFGPDTGFGPDHFAHWASVGANQTNKFWAPHHALTASFENGSLSDICDTVELWIPDSGATAHMTFDPKLVSDAKQYTGNEKVIIGNDFGRSTSSSHPT